MQLIDTEEKNCGQTPGAIQGVVTARKCGCCGHHAVGIVRKSGVFVALKPGMVVAILQPQPLTGTGRPV